MLLAGLALLASPLLFPSPTYRGEPVAFWLRELCSPDAASRLRAEAAVGDFGSEAVPSLARGLEAADDGMGRRLSAVLARLWPAFARSAVPAARLREQAARCLGHLGSVATPAAPALVRRLGDVDPDVVVAVASALKQIGATALPAVGTGLSDVSPQVRAGAAGLLAAEDAFGPGVRDWRGAVMELLRDPDAAVRGRAARTLGRLGEDRPDAIAALAATVGDPVPEVSGEALDALAGMGAAAGAALPRVVKRLDDSEPGLRLKSARAVWRISGQAERALPVLTAALTDGGARWQAALILGGMGAAAEPAIPALLEAMTREIVHRPARTPASCAQALARIGPATVPGLVRLLEHEDLAVRASAAYALAAQGAAAAPAVPGLCRLLDAGDGEVGVLACQALGAIGRDARPAMPRLVGLSETGTGYLRAAALAALERIADPSAPDESGPKRREADG